ncbi:MAG: SGNH/GDSL hydrolase family protein [Bacteroidota bacterium]
MNATNRNRRNFLLQTSLASFGLLSAPQMIQAALSTELTSDLPSSPDKGQVILFQGDSITDAGRNRNVQNANNGAGMGFGYAYQIASHLLGRYPDRAFKCYNRGISGHKVFQLSDRWKEDCLDLKPDVLSLLIGVNDFWHTKTHGFKGTAQSYEDDLRRLLDRTKAAFPNIKIMLCEPFFVAGGSKLKADWFAEFDQYRAANVRIGKDYADVYIPFNTLFAKALESATVDYWCADGVHPSIAGSYLMANAWLEAFSKI